MGLINVEDRSGILTLDKGNITLYVYVTWTNGAAFMLLCTKEASTHMDDWGNVLSLHFAFQTVCFCICTDYSKLVDS